MGKAWDMKKQKNGEEPARHLRPGVRVTLA
jgi:hypothetical protein